MCLIQSESAFGLNARITVTVNILEIHRSGTTKKATSNKNKNGELTMGDEKLVQWGFLAGMGILIYLVATGGIGGTTITQPPTTPPVTPPVGGGGALDICDQSAKTTLTYSGLDKYAQGTTVTQGHRVMVVDGEKNTQYNNLGSASYAAKSSYKVLMGNKTLSLTGNTDYYPQLLEGTLECTGAKTLTGDLVKASGAGQLTFTYWSKSESANTAENVGANANNVQKFRIAASDNQCYGNPYALEKSGKGNLLCAYYNSTAYTTIEILDSGGTILAAAGTPRSMVGIAGGSVICFDSKQVFCDNKDYDFKVHYIVGTAAPVGGLDGNNFNISIASSDITIGYNTDTLAEIYGYEDAPGRSDMGVADIGILSDISGGAANGMAIVIE